MISSREILLPLCVLAAFVSTTHFVRMAWASTTRGVSSQKSAFTDTDTEPHHRLLLENSQVRVFALTIPPGQQSVVGHKRSFLTVTLVDSDVIIWKDDESPIQHFRPPQSEIHFFLGKATRGIRNDSNADYRNITIEFLDPQVTNYGYRYDTGKLDFGPSALNPPVDSEGHFVDSLDLERAEAKDVQLLPKETLPAAKGPQLLIAISALTLSAGADRKISLNAGQVLWREAGAPGLTNNGTVRTRFAVVEFKHGRQGLRTACTYGPLAGHATISLWTSTKR